MSYFHKFKTKLIQEKVKLTLAIVTFILYAIVFNWKFAALIMISIGWHESGHVWAMKKLKLPTKGFYFLPFLGGVALGTSTYQYSKDKVIVSLMGPIWGMLLALITWLAFIITGNPYLGAAAYWQGFLNLFNLLPISPLDGGHVVKSILTTFSAKLAVALSFVSSLCFLGLFIKLKSVVFLFAMVLSVLDFWAGFKYKVEQDMSPLSKREILVTLVSYLLLTCILLLITVSSLMFGADFKLFVNI